MRIQPRLNRMTAWQAAGGILLTSASLLAATSACRKESAANAPGTAPAAMPARPVQAAAVVQKAVPSFLTAYGTLAAFNSVDLVPQVSGQLMALSFTEGMAVTNGQLLATIDPRPYEAALDKARATLIQDRINLQLKQDTLARYQKLYATNLVSEQDFQKYESEASSAEAQALADAAALQLAQLNLDYCFIRSPLGGVTGKRLIDVGNIVSAGGNSILVNIRTIDPLYVDFPVSERFLTATRAAMGQTDDGLAVSVCPEGSTNPAPGTLQLIQNTVDTQTGTIAMRAVVPNPEHRLWPGQFVKVQLVLGIQTNALIVPSGAVMDSQKGPYLFAIGADKKAEFRLVATGETPQDGWIVIARGVRAGEKVVVVGQMLLADGVPVEEITEAAP